jgi:enoyl-CoA hydratase/carnithine racemase
VSALLKTERLGPVVLVTIDHPPSNLVDRAFLVGLAGLLDSMEADDSIKSLVFRSADPDFFLMHGDVESILRMPTGVHEPAREPNAAASLFERLSRGRLVSIGVVDGAARGGGCEFLTALDLRLGSPRVVIGQPEVAMGIIPGAGGTARWPRLIGRSRALELLLTGRDVGAEEALAIGWLNAVIPSDHLMDRALELARRIGAMPASSIAAVKRVVNASLAGLSDALVAETDELGRLIAEGGHQERMRRFLAAGGQTRDSETQGMEEIMRATIG